MSIDHDSYQMQHLCQFQELKCVDTLLCCSWLPKDISRQLWTQNVLDLIHMVLYMLAIWSSSPNRLSVIPHLKVLIICRRKKLPGSQLFWNMKYSEFINSLLLCYCIYELVYNYIILIVLYKQLVVVVDDDYCM